MNIELILKSQIGDRNIIIPTSQAHGNKIVIIESGEEELKDCDALITKNPNFTIGVRTADCSSICFSDGEKIGVAHVGWKGLCAGMIEKMFTHFDRDKTEIYVAPFLNSFKIQKDFCYEAIFDKFGEKYFKIVNDEIIFDFKGAIMSLLPDTAVFDKRNMETDMTLPSNRRDQTKERLVTLVSFLKK